MLFNPEPLDLMGSLPAYFQEIPDFIELMSTEQIELQLLLDTMDQVLKNFFIQTADANTISMHEQLLGLVVEDGDTLEIRRWRILNRYRRRPPFTLVTLYTNLHDLVGVGNAEVVVDYPGYHVDITVVTSDQQVLYEVYAALIAVLPAHLTYDVAQQFLPVLEAEPGVGYVMTTATSYTIVQE